MSLVSEREQCGQRGGLELAGEGKGEGGGGGGGNFFAGPGGHVSHCPFFLGTFFPEKKKDHNGQAQEGPFFVWFGPRGAFHALWFFVY